MVESCVEFWGWRWYLCHVLNHDRVSVAACAWIMLWSVIYGCFGYLGGRTDCELFDFFA